jgi:hypothetical protein
LPSDALAIINHINAFGPGAVTGGSDGPPYLDTTGNDQINSSDALAVINYINAFGPESSQGEGESDTASGEQTLPDADLLAILADDLAMQVTRRKR